MAITESSTLNQPSATAFASIHAGAAPGANTNCFTAKSVGPNASALRLTICLTTTSKVDVRVSDGTTAYSQHLFANADCTASNIYTCVFGARRFANADGVTLLTYSIRLQTDSVIQTLNIEEIIGPVT